MNRRRRHRTRLAVAWTMMTVGVIATPVGIWLSDEPPVLVVMSGCALIAEAIIALLVVTEDSGPPDP